MVDKNIQDLVNLYRSGKLVIAEKKIIKEIEKNPNSYFLYDFLGVVLTDQKKLDEAVISFRKSIKINPNYAQGYNNLGAVLFKLKKVNESINILNQAIKINSNFADPYVKLGVIFKQLNKINESVLCYQKAIQIKPNYILAHNNLGNVFKEIGKIEEAIESFERAIQINSNSEIAISNLANLFIDIGRVEDARKSFFKLISLKPNNLEYKINNGLLVTPIVQSTKEINYYRNEYKKNLKDLRKFKPQILNPGYLIEANFFYLAFHNKDNLKIMKNTSNLFRKIIPNVNYNIKKKKKEKRIRIGFISELLTNHTIGKLFGGLIKNIDRKKFDATIVHTFETKESTIKKNIDNSANKIIYLEKNIEGQQKQIENENFDIIFYPEIGMSPTTYFLAFSRFAPVQIVSWGHPETTGINTIDYFLSSALLEADNIVKKYSERLICLSQFPLYYKPPQNLGLLKNRIDLALPEKYRLYGCPQSLFKLHPDFDKILTEILHKDSKAKIVLIGGEGLDKFWIKSLKKRWSKSFPILNERVLFTKRLSLLEFISLCNCVDVLLDPIYFGGGNTFLESMMVGTPTITMPGTHLKANITAAAYKQMKISNPPIVKNSKEYIDLAVKLAQDIKKNQALRKESKIAANKYLYRNLNALKEFEKFLEEAYITAQSGNKLKDGYVVKVI